MTFDLDRFLDGQRDTYEGALAELHGGHKTGHWIWFIFPHIRGIWPSENSRYYGIVSLDEARAYLAHPILDARLRECLQAVLDVADRSAVEILGPLDAQKVHACATLFRHADPTDPLFDRVLDRFYDGQEDPVTLERLATTP